MIHNVDRSQASKIVARDGRAIGGDDCQRMTRRHRPETTDAGRLAKRERRVTGFRNWLFCVLFLFVFCFLFFICFLLSFGTDPCVFLFLTCFFVFVYLCLCFWIGTQWMFGDFAFLRPDWPFVQEKWCRLRQTSAHLGLSGRSYDHDLIWLARREERGN